MNDASRPTERARPGLLWVQRAGVCVIAFVLPAFNGRPYGAEQWLPVRPDLRAHHLGTHVCCTAITGCFDGAIRARWCSCFWARVVVAALSTIANANPDSVWNLIWSYFAPFILFMSIFGLTPSSADYESIFFSFSLGLALRFSIGAWTFYQTWGIPSFSDLSVARFDLIQMDSYMSVTFGNTSSTASVLAVSIPVLVTSLMIPRPKRAWLISLPALVVCVANVFITGSR